MFFLKKKEFTFFVSLIDCCWGNGLCLIQLPNFNSVVSKSISKLNQVPHYKALLWNLDHKNYLVHVVKIIMK